MVSEISQSLIDFRDRLFENSAEIATTIADRPIAIDRVSRSTSATPQAPPVPSFNLQVGGANVLAVGAACDRLDFENPKNVYTYPFELKNIGLGSDNILIQSDDFDSILPDNLITHTDYRSLCAN